MVRPGNILVSILVFLFFSCKNNDVKSLKLDIEPPEIIVPKFNTDSAYSFIEDQVNFGPRVPNSQAHLNCAIYLKNKLSDYGAEVIIQSDVPPEKLAAVKGNAIKEDANIGGITPGTLIFRGK